jgi:gluconolactonase
MTDLEVTDVQVVGVGLLRPEGVAVRRSGQAFAADGNATVSEIRGDGSLRPIGPAGDLPNGINFTPDGSALIIADFGANQLQRCDLETGQIDVICDAVGARSLARPNYPAVTKDGTIYCSCSTASDVIDCLVYGIDDGFIFRITPDGNAEVLVDHMLLPNGLAIDESGSYLYVVRTSAGDVVRFPILDDGRLGAQEPYGPGFGDRTEWGEAGARAAWGDNPLRDYTTLDPTLQPRWGFPDGCAFDIEGNLWVTLTGRNTIVAITPDEGLKTVFDDPKGRLFRPSNIAFGGPDMQDVYFGSAEADYVVQGRSSVPGLELPGQG